MSRTGTESLGTVFRLVYRSHALIAPDRRELELGAIFGVARATNALLGVTGALLAWQDAFVQVLEGDEPDVRALYETIRVDARHGPVVVLDADTVPHRVFPRWSMARVGDDDGVDIPVHRDGPVAGGAPAPSTGDPGQDTMLDLMREYAQVGAAPPRG